MESPDKQIYSISMVDGRIHLEKYTGSSDIVDNVIDFDHPNIMVHDSDTLFVRARKENLEEILCEGVLSEEVLSDEISIPVIHDGSAFADWF